MAKRKNLSTSALPRGFASPATVLHEGWCTKESGSTFMGKTNWRRRWFKLVQKERIVKLEYYRGINDRNPAGSVALDVTYCTRQLESHEKPYPNCFAVGPLVDDGATRTYYISCRNMLAMQEWMTVIDAAIQGVPEEAQRRRRTVTNHYSMQARSVHSRLSRNSSSGLEDSQDGGSTSDSRQRMLDSFQSDDLSGAEFEAATYSIDGSLVREEVTDEELCEDVDMSDDEEDEQKGAVGGAKNKDYDCPDSSLSPSARIRLYSNQSWRMEHWRELCILNRVLKWVKPETKDGVTLARCKFGKGKRGLAAMKVEGVLESDPDTVYNFLKISTKEGGKLDYFFRNELLLDDIEDEPKATVIFNQFLLPLPRISARDVVALKMWVPQYVTRDSTCGMVMFSVDHPLAPQVSKDSRRIYIETSGLLLSPFPGPEGAVYTRAVIIVRIALYGALHRMLKGAYSSGLLKLGMRTTFQHMQEQLMRFVELTNI